jgi:DNA-binding beta-propeller fold protein YncE
MSAPSTPQGAPSQPFGQGIVSTLAGSGLSGFADAAKGLAAQFNSPYRLAVDRDLNVYVADPLNNRIRRITQGDEGTVVTIAGSARGYADGKGSQAQFFMPEGIAISPVDGAIYVADSGNNRMRTIVLCAFI